MGSKGSYKNDTNKIINISDAHICQYIRYYFQKSIVNLIKTKKDDLKTILSPLLVEYYENPKQQRMFLLPCLHWQSTL